MDRLWLLAVALFLVAGQARSEDSLEQKVKDQAAAWLESNEISGAGASGNDFIDVIGKYFVKLELEKDSIESGRNVKFQAQAVSDALNDVIGSSSVQQIIARSGFKLQNHHVLSEDGYVTQLVRIINPLADRLKLKGPPVMLFHGALLDSASYLWASALQHHPEAWPQVDKTESGRIPNATLHLLKPDSSSRSLAFALANNGYDCWLIGQRGSNEQNTGHIRFKSLKYFRQKVWPYNPQSQGGAQISLSLSNITDQAKNGDSKRNQGASFRYEKDWYDYWKFSMDEIVRFEIPKQIDKVLRVTGWKQVSVVSMSTSGQAILSLLASNEQYGRKIDSHIVLAPTINNLGSNLWLKMFQLTWCRLMPDEVGTLLFTNLIQSRQLRDLIIDQAYKSLRLRYTLLRLFINAIAGQSAEFQTLLELPVLGHLLMPIGFRHLKHYCQQVVAGKLQHFDHGPSQNLLVYGTKKPPVYDIFDLKVKKWIVIMGENDNIATEDSALQLARFAQPKPLELIRIPGYNHLDLLAGTDCDEKVVQPIINFLDRHHQRARPGGLASPIGGALKTITSADGLSKLLPSATGAPATSLSASDNDDSERQQQQQQNVIDVGARSAPFNVSGFGPTKLANQQSDPADSGVQSIQRLTN